MASYCMRPWQALHCLPIAERRSKAQLTVSLSETLIVRLAIVVVAALALVGVASATADVGLLNQTQPGHHVHGDAQEAGQRAENAIDHHGAEGSTPAQPVAIMRAGRSQTYRRVLRCCRPCDSSPR